MGHSYHRWSPEVWRPQPAILRTWRAGHVAPCTPRSSSDSSLMAGVKIINLVINQRSRRESHGGRHQPDGVPGVATVRRPIHLKDEVDLQVAGVVVSWGEVGDDSGWDPKAAQDWKKMPVIVSYKGMNATHTRIKTNDELVHTDNKPFNKATSKIIRPTASSVIKSKPGNFLIYLNKTKWPHEAALDQQLRHLGDVLSVLVRVSFLYRCHSAHLLVYFYDN